MIERKRLWVNVALSAWMLLASGVHYVVESGEPFVGDIERWEILDSIMIWGAAVGLVVVLVYNVIYGLKNDRWS